MHKYDKILLSDEPRRLTVLKVLELFDGESFNDSIETLKMVEYYLRQNNFLDFHLAKEMINSAGGD